MLTLGKSSRACRALSNDARWSRPLLLSCLRQVERLRREDYEPKQRRRLFAREEEDYEGDYLGTSSFASSSSDEESMPLWPPGGAAAPSGVGPSQRPAWGPAAAPQRQDRLKGSSGAPPVSETEREVNRIEAALREAWRQSQAAPGTATPPALRRPGSAAAESPPTTSPGSRSSRSSGASNVRSSDLGLPVLGVPSSTPAKLPRVPPPTASASGVLLTVAAGLAANKQLESEHAAFEAQMASLMQKRSGAGASPSGQQLARPSSSPAPTPAASQQAPARAGATGPSTQRAAMSPPAASPLVLGDEPLQFPKELKTALRSGKGAGAAQRPATRAGSGGDGQAQARQQQTHGAGAEQQGRSQALPTGAQSGSGASDELQVLRKAAQAATAKRRVHRPPKPANGAAPASTDGQGTAPAPLPGSSRQEAAEGRPLFPAGVQLALQGKTQGQQRPIRPDGSAHVAKQAPSLQRPGSAAPGAAPVVPPPPGKQQQQPPLQRPRPRRP